jgi:hypothetical protein
MTVKVTGISGDEDTLVISFDISGTWTIDYDTVNISGYSHNIYQSNTLGGLNLEQYLQLTWTSGSDFFVPDIQRGCYIDQIISKSGGRIV